MGKLTAAAVKAVRYTGEPNGRPQRIGDGDGLYLQIAASGSRSWLFRFTLRGKAREMGLGAWGDGPEEVSLSKARVLASEARAHLREGRDPIKERDAAAEARRRAELAAEAQTFRAAAEALIGSKKAGWRNAKHADQWGNTLEAYVYPELGDRPVAEISTEDVLSVLRPIWTRVPETASRVRQRIEVVLDAAAVKGWRTGDNPARWKEHLAGELPQPRKVKRVRHRPALAWDQMPSFMNALAAMNGDAIQALRFVILTAARTGEVREARWSEIDFEAKVWTVPGHRMKAGRAHRVALSAAAIDVLKAVLPLKTADDSLIFPGRKSGVPLSDMTLSMVIRRMNAATPKRPQWRDMEGRAIVPHGFRSTFRDWAGETRPEGREVVEAALAHTVRDKTEAAYARSDLLEKRRPLMEAWGQHCTGAAQSAKPMIAEAAE